jgi:serine/threonine-protein kinase SRPK3
MLFRRLCQSSAAISRVLRIRLTSSMANTDANGQNLKDIPTFTFSEEPLGLPGWENFGYFQGGPGLTLGPDCRFKLQAKLGFGSASSVWLARDCM